LQKSSGGKRREKGFGRVIERNKRDPIMRERSVDNEKNDGDIYKEVSMFKL